MGRGREMGQEKGKLHSRMSIKHERNPKNSFSQRKVQLWVAQGKQSTP